MNGKLDCYRDKIVRVKYVDVENADVLIVAFGSVAVPRRRCSCMKRAATCWTPQAVHPCP
jgi:hypothetical protein